MEESLTPFRHGNSLEHFIEGIMEEDLGLKKDDDAYALEQELPPVPVELPSPNTGRPTRYTVYPVDVWVDPGRREAVRAAVKGEWAAWDADPEKLQLSPTAAAVFRLIGERERRLDALYAEKPEEERKPAAERRLLRGVGKRPTMEAQARRWLSHNRGGVRCLRKEELDGILDAGDRAFNLRVADPYMRYQMQGIGFTWSFFTDKDPQDIHVHSAPVVEIYGVLEGELEVWWKAYYDRGTSAWCRRVLKAGDWLEVDSLQCHIVHWVEEGKGVVFKAGPGPLAEVGKLGVKGKTPCGTTARRTAVRALETRGSGAVESAVVGEVGPGTYAPLSHGTPGRGVGVRDRVFRSHCPSPPTPLSPVYRRRGRRKKDSLTRRSNAPPTRRSAPVPAAGPTARSGTPRAGRTPPSLPGARSCAGRSSSAQGGRTGRGGPK